MKKSILLFVFTIIISQVLFAQEEGKNTSFGFSLFPKITYQISDDKDIGANQSDFNLSLYGDVFIDLRAKMQLKTGIGLHTYQFDQVDFSPTFGCDNVNGSVNLYGSFFKITTTAYYVGIPLEIRVLLSEKTNHLYFKAGIENLIGLWNKRTVALYECGIRGNVEEDSDDFYAKRYILLAKLGVGYEFQLLENAQMYVEPVVDYAFTNSFYDVNLRTNYRIVNVGILAGIRF